MKRFLIINPFGIGDVLFTTPVISVLREKYPDCVIGYWCNERVAPLLKSDTKINMLFPLSRGDIKRIYKGIEKVLVLIKLIRQIRREKFDVAFDFSLDSRYGLWSKLAGIKKRIGFDYKERGRFLTDKIALGGYSDKHVVDYYLDLLKFADIRISIDIPYSLVVSKESSTKAKDILSGRGIKPSDLVIGMAMGGGASWGRDAIYKQWPAEKFAQVAQRLVKDLKAKVILLGSSDEKKLADKIKNDEMLDLTGKLNLEELAAVIKELKLLVCNDGGPLHMAAALGVKTVSIFGPVDEKVYGPYPKREGHIVVKKDVSCRPCYRNFRFLRCDNGLQCLKEISVEEVFENVRKSV